MTTEAQAGLAYFDWPFTSTGMRLAVCHGWSLVSVVLGHRASQLSYYRALPFLACARSEDSFCLDSPHPASYKKPFAGERAPGSSRDIRHPHMEQGYGGGCQ
jgi:hypothetical protein